MGTYKVASSWNKLGSGWQAHGKKYKMRRRIQVYEHGIEKPVDSYWEYKGVISDLTTTKKTHSTETSGDLPGSDPLGSQQETKFQYMPDGTIREVGLGEMTSAQAELYSKYSSYLDNVTFYNNDLRAKLELQYELLQKKQGFSDHEKRASIEREYTKLKIPRLTYNAWTIKSQLGQVPDMELYKPPSLDEEITYHPTGQYLEGKLNKFVKGMKFGWTLADSIGLTRIAAMGVAGMPPGLVGSMAISTAIHGELQRIAGRQDVITATTANLRDALIRVPGTTSGENYKQMYIVLNDNAKRQGYIKSDWKLRLSRNIPVKERWRRLYVTLLAHIERKRKLQGAKPQRKQKTQSTRKRVWSKEKQSWIYTN